MKEKYNILTNSVSSFQKKRFEMVKKLSKYFRAKMLKKISFNTLYRCISYRIRDKKIFVLVLICNFVWQLYD